MRIMDFVKMVVLYRDCDLIAELEKFMSDLGHSLMIKYGLRGAPSEELCNLWAREVRKYIAKGYDRERAGDLAASEVFPSYNTHVYASEADTIEMLLQQVADKN